MDHTVMVWERTVLWSEGDIQLAWGQCVHKSAELNVFALPTTLAIRPEGGEEESHGPFLLLFIYFVPGLDSGPPGN